MLAKLPEKYIIAGDEVTPYLVFFNSHDGSSGVKVAMTPGSCGMPEYLEFGSGYCKAYLDGSPHRKCSASGSGCP